MARKSGAFWDVPVKQAFMATKQASDRRLAALVAFAYEECVRRSPVLKGEFRGNWRVALGSPNLSFDESVRSGTPFGAPPSPGERQSSSVDEVVRKISKSGLHDPVPDKIYVSNSLPYALKLEYGYSKRQAPHGIVRIVQKIIDRITRVA